VTEGRARFQDRHTERVDDVVITAALERARPVKPASAFLVATGSILVASTLLGCGSSERPATWSYISPVIFQPNCATASCHSPAAAAGGLDFSDPDKGYSSLTRLWVWIVDRNKAGATGCEPHGDTTVCEKDFRPLVTPYDPDQSRLVNMLRARNAPRMPPDRPLDEADIELVERWILNGAKKSESDAPPPSGGSIDGAADAIDDGPSDGVTDAGQDAANDGPAATDGMADAPRDGGIDGDAAAEVGG
jgi:hypothetical protein